MLKKFNSWFFRALKIYKGNGIIADLRYGGKDTISPSTLIFGPIKDLLGIYTLHIPPVTG